MSNLRLINETTASSVTSMSVTDVFSSDFDIYKITFDTTGTNTGSDIEMRLINSSGSVVVASEYDSAFLQLKSNTSYVTANRTNIDTIENIGVSSGVSSGAGTVIYVFNPFSSSSYTFLLIQNASWRSADSSLRGHKGISVLTQTSSITGFQVLCENTSLTLGYTTRTYGLRVDS
jgi:hypothetical protein